MLDSDTVKGFVGSCLLSRFDSAAAIPAFHEELWEMCCSRERKVAIAAPRGHAKSTSVTLSYLLAAALFRESDFILLVSDTEGQAKLFLADIKIELTENEDLMALFGVSSFVKDTETDLIVMMDDGYQFRIIAKGSEQKVRGLKWRNKRPNLIVGDDLENDEIVMNKDRREKFRNWLMKALIPCLSDEGRIIIVGTILHLDSALERLLNDPGWHTARYAAHNDDFSEILWPERFTQERLEAIRDSYVRQGMPEGYSQEYLNYPIDEESAYFRRDDFRFFDKDTLDYDRLTYYAGVDLAITQKEKSDYTVIVVIGVNHNNHIHVVDVVRGRWDGKEIIDNIMNVQTRWKPDIMAIEEGQISKSLLPFLKEEMLSTGTFINIKKMVPVVDKESRARSIQARVRQGTVFFDGHADWYADFEQELVRFPRDVHDDQVDAFAWVGLTLADMTPGLTKDEYVDMMYEDEFDVDNDFIELGADMVTGY